MSEAAWEGAGQPPVDVDALHAELEHLRDMRTEFDTTRQQVEHMQQNWQQLQGFFAPQHTPSAETQFWSNPTGYLDRMRQEVVQEATFTQAQLQARDQFWHKFYEENPELVGKEWAVRGIIQHDPALQQLAFRDPQTRGKLAAAVRDHTQAVAQKFGAGPRSQRLPSVGDRMRAARAQRRRQPEEDEVPSTLGEMARQDRERRQQRWTR